MCDETAFLEWLAKQLKAQSKEDIQKVCDEKYALYFLMTWNIFEKTLFDTNCQFHKALNQSHDLIIRLSDDFSSEEIKALNRFFDRYKYSSECVKHLFNQKTDKTGEARGFKSEFKSYLKKENFSDLLAEKEKAVKFALCIIIRYRNNMFHGNKGVSNWLAYRQQINDCTCLMQHFISKNEQ